MAAYTDIGLYRRLLRELRPYRPHLVGLFFLSLVSPVLALLTPLPLKIAVDNAVGSRPIPHLLRPLLPPSPSSTAVLLVATGLLVAIGVLTQLHAVATALLQTYTGEKLVLGFRAELFRHAQRLSLSYHDSRGSSDSMYRIQYDTSALQYIAIDGVVPLLAAALTLVSMLYVTMRVDWQLAVVALAVSPIIFLLSRMYRRNLRRRWRELKKLDSAAMSVVQEALAALRVVKAFGQEDREEERFARRSREGFRARLHLSLAEGGLGLLVGITTSIGTAAVVFLGIRHVQSGVLTLGELLLVMGYLAQLYGPLKTLGTKAATFQSHLASAERAFAILDHAPDVAESPDARPLVRAAGGIIFRDVSFGYRGGTPVLQQLSFDVPPGSRVGVAGRTGVGKTTLVGLLNRFHDPTAGQILLDGVDLREYRLADLRSQFAIVLQEPVLLSASIAENIAYARPTATKEEIVEAARAADAHDFIVDLPEGYDTLVGERGMRLSGGERQRIALARAFLKDAPLLILDEPTSSVDFKTEARILEAIERLAAGRTTFTIAHRLSTLDNCDLRFTFEAGRLVSADSRPAANVRAIPGTPDVGDTDLAEHPAVKAWCRLDPKSVPPDGIQTLKPRTNGTHVKKSYVYRLEGVGPRARAVIAKLCRSETAAVERTIYEKILPKVPLPTLDYYGFVPSDDQFSWLFLEDAGAEPLALRSQDDRAMVARWLGVLHTAASRIDATAQLPDRGPRHYLEHLRSGRATIRENLANPALQREERVVLEGIISQCDLLEKHWNDLERPCERMPATLVHGDFVEKNIRMRYRRSRRLLFAFDWETAGRGVPAADLQFLTGSSSVDDLTTYWSTVREFWPDLRLDEIVAVARMGGIFRLLAAIDWATAGLRGDHILGDPVGRLRKYQSMMEVARSAIQWEQWTG